MKLGAIIKDEGLKRVLEYFVSAGNKPSYHNEIFRHVRGSKTTVSRALHVLSEEYELLDSGYVQIPRMSPSPRMISVLMFHIKDEYLPIIQEVLQI